MSYLAMPDGVGWLSPFRRQTHGEALARSWGLFASSLLYYCAERSDVRRVVCMVVPSDVAYRRQSRRHVLNVSSSHVDPGCVKLIHWKNVENTILQHGTQPHVGRIINSDDAQFLQMFLRARRALEFYTTKTQSRHSERLMLK